MHVSDDNDNLVKVEKDQPKRLSEWDDFADMMHEYIEKYTIDKYKSSVAADIDLIELADAKFCIFNVLKYALRMYNGRGKAYDIEKIAHYAQLAYTKIKQEEASEMINVEKAG